jgi:hypothetical protein
MRRAIWKPWGSSCARRAWDSRSKKCGTFWSCGSGGCNRALRCAAGAIVEVRRTNAGTSKVRVEVLYVAECPSHPAAVQTVKEVLTADGAFAEVREVLVSNTEMASKLRFCGSPTIRINGRDVATEPLKAHGFALSCRFYADSKYTGLPPFEMVRRAVIEAQAEDKP